jgi:hypothetical protein
MQTSRLLQERCPSCFGTFLYLLAGGSPFLFSKNITFFAISKAGKGYAFSDNRQICSIGVDFTDTYR